MIGLIRLRIEKATNRKIELITVYIQELILNPSAISEISLANIEGYFAESQFSYLISNFWIYCISNFWTIRNDYDLCDLTN